jgi:hypothetical protein
MLHSNLDLAKSNAQIITFTACLILTVALILGPSIL